MNTRKETAIRLRKQGHSIGVIEKKLGIARSTLSGWFKNVTLTTEQKNRLFERWREGLVAARSKAADWHRGEKRKRLQFAKEEAENFLDSINLKDDKLVELAMAMLYLGEGAKGEYTAMGNSDPGLLSAFVTFLIDKCNIAPDKIGCSLYLRADQNADETINFWKSALGLKRTNFKYVSKDKRTLGSSTYPGYKGVCMVSCGNVAIQRKLLNISRGFCERIIAMHSKRG